MEVEGGGVVPRDVFGLRFKEERQVKLDNERIQSRERTKCVEFLRK